MCASVMSTLTNSSQYAGADRARISPNYNCGSCDEKIIVDDNESSKISFKHRSGKPDEYICMSVNGDLSVFALEVE
ncbi:hypothetical protein KIN20_031047 [Parelaphostrongylus tenuis]|uniref:Uncharacterized protein n=1 Tax=Parelaphostrongylus tenuis TaxID=148309 RepID=A0AAD5WGX0_PARTN|nr:hypothetical protein KIN20_031047 [Parelaphostrongylus tenuis]